jgi:DNA-binding MarR family transcriptional regulator
MVSMQPGDVERAITFFTTAAGSYSAVELATALGWTVPRAQTVLYTLERRQIVRRLPSAVDHRLSTYTYLPQADRPPPGA